MFQYLAIGAFLFSTFCSSWAGAVPQNVSEPGVERSIQILKSVQKTILEQEKTLLLNQEILQKNGFLLRQNFQTLTEIRKIRKDSPSDVEILMTAMNQNLEAQEENDQVLLETRESISKQMKLHSKNEKILQQLQAGNALLDINNEENFPALLAKLNQSLEKSQTTLEKNKAQLRENQNSLVENKQTLASFRSGRKSDYLLSKDD